MIYLDNAATTKPCAECIKAVAETMENSFGNASSLHGLGTVSLEVIARAKEIMLSSVSGTRKPFDGEVIFTSGATESNNTAINSVFEGKKAGKIITTAIEHPSVARAAGRLENRGIDVLRLLPKDFQNAEEFVNGIIRSVDKNTLLVSAMAVNNENGFKIDVPRLYREVKKINPRTVVHIDAVQGFLKVPLDGDSISVSGHKIHASKGIGALFVKKNLRLSPLLVGGGQQSGLRSGTEPVELIAGFEAAVKAYRYDIRHFELLKANLLDRLSKIDDIVINSSDECVPNIVNFSVRGVRSEIMLHSLEEQDIYVSSGSACSKGKKSEVLPAFGISDSDADCAVRVSFSAENTVEDISALCDKIAATAERIRR